MIDATVIAAATRRDEEAPRAGHKRGKAINGLKAHVAANADTALVEEVTVTPGNVNDGRAGGKILPENPGDVPKDFRGQYLCSAMTLLRPSTLQLPFC
ncbi:transposase [Microvirga roseola]|uniref:transposase n=1 Tax=Microvirga roseola TaxID=2883126 RepID=UPI001E41DF7A